jgi:hypothetical protein
MSSPMSSATMSSRHSGFSDPDDFKPLSVKHLPMSSPMSSATMSSRHSGFSDPDDFKPIIQSSVHSPLNSYQRYLQHGTPLKRSIRKKSLSLKQKTKKNWREKIKSRFRRFKEKIKWNKKKTPVIHRI